MSDSNDFTTSPTQGQTTNTPQTYEEWKQRHGYQSPSPRELEIGQHVKATPILAAADYYDYADKTVIPSGTLGIITAIKNGVYFVKFENNTTCWCGWDEDEEIVDIEPVGKSPSELAYEQSERERLAGFKQMSLFEAVSE